MLEKTVWRPSRHESKLYWQVEESETGNRVSFDSLGQNQRVFEAFSLILPRVRLRRLPSKFGSLRLV